MKCERGFGLIEILVVLAIISVSTAVIAPQLIHSQQESKKLTIDSDRATLKTKCTVYYLNTSTHATKTNPLSELMSPETVKFVDWLSKQLNLPVGQESTYDQIDARFGWVSTQKLIDEKLLDAVPVDDRYILDTQSYTLYHVTDAEDVWEHLFVSSGAGTTDLGSMSIRRFPIETTQVYMSVVNSTCMAGNAIYAGGKGTMTLAKIEVFPSTQTVTDISSKLTNAVEVYGISNIGNNLRVEYLDTSGRLVIADVEF